MSAPRAILAVLAIFAVGAALLIAVPGTAQAQAFSVEVGSYTIPDPDGTVVVPVMVDPAGTSLSAVGIDLGYDPTLVQFTMCEVEGFTACADDGAGTVSIQAVTADMNGFGEAFIVASITFEALGSERTEPLTVTIGEAYDGAEEPQPLAGEGIDGELTVSSRAPAATLASDCVNNDGRVTATLDNPMDDPVTFTIAVEGLPDTNTVVESMTTVDTDVVGVADDAAASVSVTADGGFGTLVDTSISVRCDAEASFTVDCDGVGIVSVVVVNYSGSFATYAVTFNNNTQQRSISDGLRTTITSTVSNDGGYPLVVTRNGAEILNTSVDVDCGNENPTPVPTPAPTPAPTPPAGGGGIVGSDDAVEVMVTTTCLAGNGRVDFNIVNTTTSPVAYRIEFGALSARQLTVAAEDFWRMPITGRPEGDHDVVVKRDGVTVVDEPVTVNCDTDPPVVVSPEIQVVNACRNDRGYLLFQFANQTAANRGWVIEFEGVPNRSTSAAAYAGTVRAVTGRPNGIYDVTVRSGSERTEFQVTVDCLPPA